MIYAGRPSGTSLANGELEARVRLPEIVKKGENGKPSRCGAIEAGAANGLVETAPQNGLVEQLLETRRHVSAMVFKAVSLARF